jgi:hypothetical protein
LASFVRKFSGHEKLLFRSATRSAVLIRLRGTGTRRTKSFFSIFLLDPYFPSVVQQEEQDVQPKRTVTGTDADLRKLPLKDAKVR